MALYEVTQMTQAQRIKVHTLEDLILNNDVHVMLHLNSNGDVNLTFHHFEHNEAEILKARDYIITPDGIICCNNWDGEVRYGAMYTTDINEAVEHGYRNYN